MEVRCTSTLLVLPPSCIRLVLPLEWREVLICLSAPTRLWYKLCLERRLSHRLRSHILLFNRLVSYRLVSDRLVSYRLVAYGMVSLGGYVTLNRLSGIISRLRSDRG